MSAILTPMDSNNAVHRAGGTGDLRKHKMTNLLNIAEGILDSAASEYLDSNLESIKSVKQYAEGALDVYHSDSEAEKIHAACTAWVKGIESGELHGSNDYYYTVEKPLSND